jgi:hypothetical protein
MATHNRSGGPNTKEGKAISSKNALKLGATTMNVSSPEEQQLVDECITELTDYYQPKSPLEKMQIARIAICKAKLSRLYEVEQIRLKLVQKNIKNNPAQILNEMSVSKGLVREMALEGLRRGDITLPCGLSVEDLTAIEKEVDRFHGSLEVESDLQKYFPRLVKFLKQYSVRGISEKPTILERFEVVIQRIYKAMRRDIYLGNLNELFEEMLEDKTKKVSTGDEDIKELMQEINPNYVPPEPVKHQINVQQLQSFLPLFVHLKRALEDAQQLIERYEESKALLVRSALLPSAEADLLMRYQTALERRLSSSIGELLALQKR